MTLRAFRRLQCAQAIRELGKNPAHRIMRNAGAMRVEAAGLQQEQKTGHLSETAFHRVVDRAQRRQIGGDAFVMVADGYEMIRPRFLQACPTSSSPDRGWRGQAS